MSLPDRTEKTSNKLLIKMSNTPSIKLFASFLGMAVIRGVVNSPEPNSPFTWLPQLQQLVMCYRITCTRHYTRIYRNHWVVLRTRLVYTLVGKTLRNFQRYVHHLPARNNTSRTNTAPCFVCILHANLLRVTFDVNITSLFKFLSLILLSKPISCTLLLICFFSFSLCFVLPFNASIIENWFRLCFSVRRSNNHWILFCFFGIP